MGSFEIYQQDAQVLSHPLIAKIQSFGSLPNGWDFGAGIAPSDSVIQKAEMLYYEFEKEGIDADATPMTNGGITLIFYSHDNFIDVRISNDLSLDVRSEKGIGSEYQVLLDEKNVSLNRIETLINETFLQCFSSEPSTSKNTPQVNAVSSQIHSIPLEKEYQSFQASVLSDPLGVFASILVDIMKAR